MKKRIILVSFLVLFIPLFLYAEKGDYTYSILDPNPTSFGESRLNFKLKLQVWINDDESIRGKMERVDQGSIQGGSAYLLADTYDVNPENRLCTTPVLNDTEVKLVSGFRLYEMKANWENNIMKLYARYELNNRDFAYVGPIQIKRVPVPEDGSLIVIIEPDEAKENGMWRVNGTTTWHKNGEKLTMQSGNAAIEFKDIEGFNTPLSKTVYIKRGDVANLVGNYLSRTCAVEINIFPENLKATWQVFINDVGEFSAPQPNGGYYQGLSLGTNGTTIIRFNEVPGWDKPDDYVINLTDGATSTIDNITKTTYCKQDISPPSIYVTKGIYEYKINISWEEVVASPCSESYVIYRNITDDPYSAEQIAETDKLKYDDQSASFDKAYYYWVRSKNQYGLSSFSEVGFGFKKLRQIIGVQAGLREFTDKTRISWTALFGATSYEVWRSFEGSDLSSAVRIVTNWKETSFDDISAIPEREYYYWVIAKNDYVFGSFSDYTIGKRKLAYPKCINGTFDESYEQNCIEFCSNPDATGYRLEPIIAGAKDNDEPLLEPVTYTIKKKKRINKSTSCETCERVKLCANTSIPGKLSYYKVEAYNLFGRSDYSEPVICRRLLIEPKNVKASFKEYINKVKITWDIVSVALWYDIYRSFDNNINNIEYIGRSFTNSYYDSNIDQNFYYWVKSGNDYTESSFSESAQGFPEFCDYTLSPENNNFQISGGIGQFQINVQNKTECYWELRTDSDWITIDNSILSGYGPKTILYNVAQAASNKVGTITVSGNGMNKTHNVNVREKFKLAINKSGNGMVKVDGNLYSNVLEFTPNKTVSLEYIPETGWKSSPSNPLQVNIDKDQTINVNFMANILLSKLGNGSFQVNGSSTYDQYYDVGSVLNIKAIPSQGWELLNWEGISIESDILTVTVNEPKNIIAKFSPVWNTFFILQSNDKQETVTIGNASQFKQIESTNDIFNLGTIEYIEPYLIKDIRKTGTNNENWVLVVKPIDEPATISWDSMSLYSEGSFKMTSGHSGTEQFDWTKEEVIVKNMRAINYININSSSETQYFSIYWSKYNWPTYIRLQGENTSGLYISELEIGFDAVERTAPSAPLPPTGAYTCDMNIIGPDGETLKEYFQTENYSGNEWDLLLNPSGTAENEPGNAVLSWDFSDSFLNMDGCFSLVKISNYEEQVIIPDMKETATYLISGFNESQNYKIKYNTSSCIDDNFCNPISGTRYTMVIFGSATVDSNIPSVGDLIAASGPGGITDCRAVEMVESDGFYYLTITGSENGEEISLRFKQKETGKIFNWHNKITFQDGATIENLDLAFNSFVTQNFIISKDWNWISFNVIPFDTSLEAIFGENVQYIKQITSQKSSTTNLNGRWIGQIDLFKQIEQGVMFCLKASEEFSFSVNGTKMPANNPIALCTSDDEDQWTWISYLPDYKLETINAISSINDCFIQITSQNMSKTKLGDRFVGNLYEMQQGLGYKVKTNGSCSELIYPSAQ